MRLVARLDQIDDVAHVLLGDGLLPGGEGQQALQGLYPVEYILRLAGNLQLRVPVHHRHMELVLNNFDVLVEGAKYVNGVLHALQADGLFDQIAALLLSLVCNFVFLLDA